MLLNKFKISICVIFLLQFIAIGISLHETIASEKTVIIKMNLPAKVRPGEKPFTLTKKFLTNIVPELKNPRLILIRDLKPTDRDRFTEEGHAFVLRGDFNNDGVADLAFIGKYGNQNDTNNSFFVIVSIREGKVTREYFTRLSVDKVSLVKEYYKDKAAIKLIYSYDTEESDFVYWNGLEYIFEESHSE